MSFMNVQGGGGRIVVSQTSSGKNGSTFQYNDEVEIDAYTINALHDLLDRSPWPMACMRVINETILRRSPTFQKGEQTWNLNDLTPLFRDVVTQYWIPYQSECAREIMVSGLVIVRLIPIGEKSKGTKASEIPLAPEVLSTRNLGQNVTITVRTDPKTLRDEFRIYRLLLRDGTRGTPQLMDDAYVLSGFGYNPSMKGVIRSPLIPVLPIDQNLAQLMHLNRTAEFALARPTGFVETPANDGAPSVDRLSYFSDQDRTKAQAEQRRGYVARSRDIDWETFADMTSGQASDRMWHPPAGFEYRADPTQWANNVLPMPKGSSMTGMPVPSRNTNLAELIRQTQHQISAIFGVPRELLVQEHAHRATGNTMLTNHVLAQTAAYWSQVITSVLTETYAIIYGTQDWCFLFGKMPVIAGQLGLDSTCKMVDSASLVTVKISALPSSRVEALYQSYLAGIVPWEELVQTSRAIQGLPPIVTPPEPAREDVQEAVGIKTDEKTEDTPADG